MAPALEYLDEAVEEAEAAARWYAERNAQAAEGFSEEIDTAESAIAAYPEAWPHFDHGTRRYLLRRYPFAVIYRVESQRILIVAWPTLAAALGTGHHGFRGLANIQMEPTRRLSRVIMSPAARGSFGALAGHRPQQAVAGIGRIHDDEVRVLWLGATLAADAAVQDRPVVPWRDYTRHPAHGLVGHRAVSQ